MTNTGPNKDWVEVEVSLPSLRRVVRDEHGQLWDMGIEIPTTSAVMHLADQLREAAKREDKHAE